MRVLKYGKGLLHLTGLSIIGLLLACGSAQTPVNADPAGPAPLREMGAPQRAAQEVALDAPAPQRAETGLRTEGIALPSRGEPGVGVRATPETASPVVNGAATGGSRPQNAPAPQVNTTEIESGIRASGRGQASAPPDLATLNLGVEAFAPTVGAARTAAATAMTAVLETLAENNVAEPDIQTSRFNIQPRYTGREVTRCVEAEMEAAEAETEPELSADESTEPEPSAEGAAEPEPATPDAGKSSSTQCYQEWQTILTGYEVTNSLTVRVRDLETISTIIDAVTEAGGDLLRFHDLSFSIRNTAALQRQARAAAVADLNARATQLAEFSSVRLGALVYLNETGYTPPAKVDFRLLAQEAAADSAAPSTPIQVGELVVEVNVNGIFEIR